MRTLVRYASRCLSPPLKHCHWPWEPSTENGSGQIWKAIGEGVQLSLCLLVMKVLLWYIWYILYHTHDMYMPVLEELNAASLFECQGTCYQSFQYSESA